MAGKWTKERRAKAAARCRQNKPWTKSTGPKSKTGKLKSSLNAIKHGDHMQYHPDIDKFLKAQNAYLNLIISLKSEAAQCANIRMDLANELINKKLKNLRKGAENQVF